ncbi:MAG: hypothetical protein NVV82_04465 [Sporocytophaga sp.]|jgi:hypothetical protein|nr:hypothetical protein [Sporocytophaga sp.]
MEKRTLSAIMIGLGLAVISCNGDDRSSNKNIKDDSTAVEATRDREIKEGDSVEQNNNTGQGRGSGAVGQDSISQNR